MTRPHLWGVATILANTFFRECTPIMSLQLRSLREKILVPTLTITLMAFSLSFGYVAKKNGDVSLHLFNSMGDNLANYIAKTSTFYIINYDLGTLEGFVKEITKFPDVAFAVFYDEKKIPLTATSKKPGDTSELTVFERKILNEEGLVLGNLSLGFSRKSLDESNRKNLLIMVLMGASGFAGHFHWHHLRGQIGYHSPPGQSHRFGRPTRSSGSPDRAYRPYQPG